MAVNVLIYARTCIIDDVFAQTFDTRVSGALCISRSLGSRFLLRLQTGGFRHMCFIRFKYHIRPENKFTLRNFVAEEPKLIVTAHQESCIADRLSWLTAPKEILATDLKTVAR